MSRLRISLFGGVAIAAAGPRPLPLPVSCRPLLARLLLHPRHALSRAGLAEALWPTQDVDAARRCLSTALWRLKQSLPGGFVLIQTDGPDELSLHAHAACWVDAHAFERRVEPLLRCAPETLSRAAIARLERGLRLVRGPALAGLDAEWALIERQRLRSLYCDALYLSTMACAAHGDWPRALAWGRLLARSVG
jgi:DNA-binding SARP family transcriptional activator